MENSNFSEKLKAKRKEFNMTQKDLGKALNVSSQLVSKWESGESTPSIDYIVNICEVFNEDISYFFNTKNKTDKQPSETNKKLTTKIKEFFKNKVKFNKKFFICLGVAVSAALILLFSLLSVYVFVPNANKLKYLNEIEQKIDNSTDAGYYNFKFTNYLNGVLQDEEYCQGYFDENGDVVCYDSAENITIKDNIKSTGYLKSIYDKPENIKTLSDIFESQVKDKDNVNLDFDEDEIKYIRKTSKRYYLVFDEKYFYDSLDKETKKNLLIKDKIKANILIEKNKFKSMSIKVKYENIKLNKQYTLETKVEFVFEKPNIEHKDMDKKMWENYYDLPNGNEEQVKQALFGGEFKTIDSDLNLAENIHEQNGYYYSHNSDDNIVTIYDNDNLSVKTTLTLSDMSGDYDFKDKIYFYNNFIFYFTGSLSARTKLAYIDINSKKISQIELSDLTNFDCDEPTFSNNYIFIPYNNKDYDDNTKVINLDNFTVSTFENEKIVFIDSNENVYYRKTTNEGYIIRQKNSDFTYMGQYMLENDGYIYAYGNGYINKYKNGVLISSVNNNFAFDFKKNTLDENLYYYENGNEIYFNNGDVFAKLEYGQIMFISNSNVFRGDYNGIYCYKLDKYLTPKFSVPNEIKISKIGNHIIMSVYNVISDNYTNYYV